MTTAQPALTPSGRDRRRAPRQTLPEDTLVFINKEPGTVIDMSSLGVGIHFVSLLPDKPQPRLIDVFHGPSRFYLPDVPVQLVNEVTLLPYPLFNALSRRRLCLQFGALSSNQRSQLFAFLRQHEATTASTTTKGGPTQKSLL